MVFVIQWCARCTGTSSGPVPRGEQAILRRCCEPDVRLVSRLHGAMWGVRKPPGLLRAADSAAPHPPGRAVRPRPMPRPVGVRCGELVLGVKGAAIFQWLGDFKYLFDSAPNFDFLQKSFETHKALSKFPRPMRRFPRHISAPFTPTTDGPVR